MRKRTNELLCCSSHTNQHEMKKYINQRRFKYINMYMYSIMYAPAKWNRNKAMASETPEYI